MSTTNDWPNVPPPPVENTTPDTPNHLIVREAKNQGGGFFAVPTNNLPEVQQPVRDTKGRFLNGGKAGPGRPKGARSKISEVLLRTLADDFIEHGADALAELRQKDIECYFRIIAQLVPKQLLMKQEEQSDIDYASLTLEEAAELLEEIQRRKFIEKAVKAIEQA